MSNDSHYHDTINPPPFVKRVNELLEIPPKPLEVIRRKKNKRHDAAVESAKDRSCMAWFKARHAPKGGKRK